MMHVASVKLIREGAYGYDNEKIDPTKPFVCSVEIVGETGKHTIKIGPQVSQGIMALIAGELADAGRKVAEVMVASSFDAERIRVLRSQADEVAR